MFFISTPGIVLYAVLAVCWLANLMFFAVNRQQDPINVNEASITAFQPKTSQYQISTYHIGEYGKQHSNIYEKRIGDFSLRFSDTGFFIEISLRNIPTNRLFGYIKENISHKLFSRPPPAIG